MTLAEFGAAIAASLNIPAYYGPLQDSTAVPYISYTAAEHNVIHADGIVVYSEEWIELRLVTKARDIVQEKLVENFLTSNGIAFYDPDFQFDEKQHIHTVYYTFMIEGG